MTALLQLGVIQAILIILELTHFYENYDSERSVMRSIRRKLDSLRCYPTLQEILPVKGKPRLRITEKAALYALHRVQHDKKQ
ncbi:hypothetical protein NIES2101_09190 [Calothrix sp. HK-06]|nr:hypothetical protein NIES2101_09190 [Calothrix sp. HK-06]